MSRWVKISARTGPPAVYGCGAVQLLLHERVQPALEPNKALRSVGMVGVGGFDGHIRGTATACATGSLTGYGSPQPLPPPAPPPASGDPMARGTPAERHLVIRPYRVI